MKLYLNPLHQSSSLLDDCGNTSSTSLCPSLPSSPPCDIPLPQSSSRLALTCPVLSPIFAAHPRDWLPHRLPNRGPVESSASWQDCQLALILRANSRYGCPTMCWARIRCPQLSLTGTLRGVLAAGDQNWETYSVVTMDGHTRQPQSALQRASAFAGDVSGHSGLLGQPSSPRNGRPPGTCHQRSLPAITNRATLAGLVPSFNDDAQLLAQTAPSVSAKVCLLTAAIVFFNIKLRVRFWAGEQPTITFGGRFR